MISNQILQTTLDGLKQITGTSMCIIDSEGTVMADNFADSSGFSMEARAFSLSQLDEDIRIGSRFFKVYDEQSADYVLVVEGEGEQGRLVGQMAVFQIQSLLVAYKERFDRDNFIKNLLLDNLLMVDIYNRSKKLHIEMEARRVVILVETGREREGIDLDKLRGIFGTKTRDFITAVDECTIVVVKEMAENEEYNDLDKTCSVILRALKAPDGSEPRIAYGTVVGELREVSRSYKEARMALEVGRIFFEERRVNAYNALGIGRLIYQLPVPLCKMFIRETLDGKMPEDFGEETLFTIDKFFENSLNVSETSRQLYIHRNTLVYRLDKLQKMTGLDLRVFEDAITFKIAMMVVKYMNHIENTDY